MFECHITIVEDGATTRETMKQVVEEAGWTFSAIDGDPPLPLDKYLSPAQYLGVAQQGARTVLV